MDAFKFQSLYQRAVLAGNTPNHGSITWSLAGNCTDPYVRSISGRISTDILRDSAVKITVDRSTPVLPYEIVLQLRCRKCEACKNNKSNLWSVRAHREILSAPRTWFSTLTLGHSLRELPIEHRLMEMQKHVTLFFKRVRKNSGRKFRYLCVFESHKDGTPHAHVLIHDLSGFLTYRHIASQWRIGFEKTILVDRDVSAVRYVTKYLAKSPVTRLRASQNYGLDHSVTCTIDPTPRSSQNQDQALGLSMVDVKGDHDDGSNKPPSPAAN